MEFGSAISRRLASRNSKPFEETFSQFRPSPNPDFWARFVAAVEAGDSLERGREFMQTMGQSTYVNHPVTEEAVYNGSNA